MGLLNVRERTVVPRGARLPLFHRPGRVALLDDDPVFRAMLKGVLERSWDVLTFSRAEGLLEHLLTEIPFAAADTWVQQDLVRTFLAERGNLPAAVMHYLARATERFGLTRICLVDQVLEGGRLGTDVLRQLHSHDWRGHAALVTGQAGTTTAVQAFNEGLIQRFEQKEGPEFPLRILDFVLLAQEGGAPDTDQIWRSTLNEVQHRALTAAGVCASLGQSLRGVMAEYVVIGAPFGALGLTAAGAIAWMPLSMAGASGPADLREFLPISEMRPVSAPGRFGDDGQLLGQVFVTSDKLPAGHPAGLDEWRARHVALDAGFDAAISVGAS
ncbi:hypothetical protein [Ramlibacter sp. AN1133]|uniref:hypothetical protein n=1 Tax=Ramlibacter sp. AN1133 TaxID=3133429 RepID=UPI0030C1C47C